MLPSYVGNWNYPTSIRFGAGRLRELAEAARDAGMHRPLLVTDSGLASLPMVDEAMAVLRGGGLAPGLFADVAGNPTAAHVEAGAAAFVSGDHDGVVALGGGSALDVGKAIGLVARQSRPLWDFEDVGDQWTRADPSLIAPIVAVPTTAGTGSEVGRASVIVDEAAHTKRLVFHPRMLPAQVVCDPMLTIGLPRGLTAATGLDALSHALEAWCAPGFHPLADGIAVESVARVFGALERACADGRDVDARAEMMAASLMGATAFQKGLGAMHAMAHVLGGRLDAHHGLLNAIVMPYVLVANHAVIGDRIARLAGMVGLEPSFDAFVDRVLELRARLDIPDTLEAVGMRIDNAPAFAEASMRDPSAATNPLALTVADYAVLYERATRGDLTSWRPEAAA